VLDKSFSWHRKTRGWADLEEKDGKDTGDAPHVPIVRTPDGRMTFLQAPAQGQQRQQRDPAPFAGHLIADGYTAYQRLLTRRCSMAWREGTIPGTQHLLASGPQGSRLPTIGWHQFTAPRE
jgi:hypothetical protein